MITLHLYIFLAAVAIVGIFLAVQEIRVILLQKIVNTLEEVNYQIYGNKTSQADGDDLC